MKIIKTINLKKYTNRKLYSPVGELSDKGRYTDLKEIIFELKKGHKIVVTDNSSGKDVTSEVFKEALKLIDVDSSTIAQLIRG